jgi:hypothetical protein
MAPRRCSFQASAGREIRLASQQTAAPVAGAALMDRTVEADGKRVKIKPLLVLG